MAESETRVRQAIDELDYPFEQFTIPHFFRHLEQLRQREIILNGAPFSGGLHGFWVRAETADYIFFDLRAHPIHQVHHLLHEAGHILLGHHPHNLALVLPPELVAKLILQLGDVPFGHWRKWELYETPDECEAEAFVRCLQHDILIAGRLAALTHPVSSIHELTRFTRGLGYSD